MFAKYQDDKTREWNKVIERYISLHKYIKEVGKISISQARSGHVNNDVQSQLADALRKTDKALYQLKEFFKPCLTNADVTDIFPRESSSVDVESLILEISKLKHENDNLQRQLSDQYRAYGGDAGLQIRDLQHELSLSQQVFDRKREILLQEKHDLEQKVLNLTQEIQHLRSAKTPSLFSLNEKEIQELSKNGNSQNAHIKKHQEFEETLKTQNDLIYNLKLQLSDSIRDREIFRSLNRTLEMELHKKTEHIEKEIHELQNEKDLADDYFNRSTLKIGESYPQMETLKYHQNFGQYVPLENGIEKYQPKFKSLEEIPVYYKPEKDFLKSKSYDFSGENENTVTLRNDNYQQYQQELEKEKEIRYPLDQLEKINEEEKMIVTQDDKVNENSII